MNLRMNAKARKMGNGQWSIPFSCAFVVKKMHDFEPAKCSIEGAMTLILRIKFSGLPNMEAVMAHVKDNCEVVVNEIGGKLIDED